MPTGTVSRSPASGTAFATRAHEPGGRRPPRLPGVDGYGRRDPEPLADERPLARSTAPALIPLPPTSIPIARSVHDAAS